MVFENLNKLVQKKDLTKSELANRSGVPYSTLCRILNGETKNPSFYDVCAIVRACEGSVDAVAELAPQKPEKTKEELYEENIRHKDEVYKEQIRQITETNNAHIMRITETNEANTKQKNTIIHILLIIDVALMLFMMTILMIDFLNPNGGWFRAKDQTGIIDTIPTPTGMFQKEDRWTEDILIV